MSDWQVVGQQRFRVDDDTVHWDVQGDIAQPELAHIFGAALQVQAVHKYALVLIAAEKQWSFPPTSRQYLAQFHRQHKAVGATAIVGIGPTAQLLVNLVLRAIELVSGRHPTTRFFGTHSAAKDWLAEQRVLLKQGLRASSV
jgi:hypothetical protein